MMEQKTPQRPTKVVMRNTPKFGALELPLLFLPILLKKLRVSGLLQLSCRRAGWFCFLAARHWVTQLHQRGLPALGSHHYPAS